jgi:hypothetical protein
MKIKHPQITSPPPSKACIYVGTREHFNFLRNNSRCMEDVLNWSDQYQTSPTNQKESVHQKNEEKIKISGRSAKQSQ